MIPLVLVFPFVAAAASCLSSTSGSMMSRCDGGRLQCVNGGSIAAEQCWGAMPTCTPQFSPLSVCQCPPSFHGFDCSLPRSPAQCPPERPLFLQHPIVANQVTTSHCSVRKMLLLACPILNLRDVRVILSFDMHNGIAEFVMLARAVSLISKRCTKVLEMAKCRLSD